NFTIQRELSHDLIVEAGWAGRWGRRLPQNANLTASPYFFKDPASGQTFAQAFDAVATGVRNGQTPAPQPWFENQLPGFGTAYLRSNFASAFTNGLVTTLFTAINRVRAQSLGLTTFNNMQVQDLNIRTSTGLSNYHGLLVTLRKRMTHGLAFD